MRIDAVQTIKDRLTVSDVLEYYGYTVKRRIPCPIHNGKDANFEVKKHTFCCHSHCGSGDVITLVQKLFNLSFPETLKKIDADFRLNIYGKHSFKDLKSSYYKQQIAKAKRDRLKFQKERADKEYWDAFDEWKRLDDNKRLYRPKSPDEELHPLFVEALQKLSYQQYLVDTLNDRRKQYV